MGMTVTEKILARAAGKKEVRAGEIVTANIDVALTHDVLGGPAYKVYKKHFGKAKVWDERKITVFPDHFIPHKDIPSAELYKDLIQFRDEQDLSHFYGLGKNYGICHIMLPQEGFVAPGMVIVGTDSHTCTHGAFGAFATGIGTTEMASVFSDGTLWFKVPETMKFIFKGKIPANVMAKDYILQIIGDIGVDGALYKSMEFSGGAVSRMNIDERMALTNMVIEAGGKNGIIEPDGKTYEYLHKAWEDPSELNSWPIGIKDDRDTKFCAVYEYNAEEQVPVVAKPHLPSNIVAADDLNNVLIDQAFIGSCTGGKLTDLIAAAEVLKRKKVAKDVRLIIIPATQKIYREALKMGLFEIFLDAGAAISAPTCGPCLGGHMGVLAKGEKCISTTNRNFRGRMGHPDSEVYLASAVTVAASAAEGHITSQKLAEGKTFFFRKPMYDKMETFAIKQDIAQKAEETEEELKISGKVFVVGDNIDTDTIIPGRYLNLKDMDELKKHAMEDLDPEKYPIPFLKEDGSCDKQIIIAGKNFGCGSSREQAPAVLSAAGIKVVIATSFARIYYRNGVNGAFTIPLESVEDLSKKVSTGDELEVNIKNLEVRNLTKDETYKIKPLSPIVRSIHKAGGLIEYKKKLNK